MIGVDTNILARAALLDDGKESELAINLIKKASQQNELFISSFAIVEFAWVLKAKKIPRQKIADAIHTLAISSSIKISSRELIINAVELYRNGKADFCDYLIIADGKNAGSVKTASFDKGLLKDSASAIHPTKY